MKAPLNTSMRYILLGGMIQILMLIWAATRGMALSYLPIAGVLIILYIVTDLIMIQRQGNRRLAAYLYLLCTFGCIFQTFMSEYLVNSQGNFIISITELAKYYLIFYMFTLLLVPTIVFCQEKISSYFWMILFASLSMLGFILLFVFHDAKSDAYISISLLGHQLVIMEFVKLGIVFTLAAIFASDLLSKPKIRFAFGFFIICAVILAAYSELGTLLIISITFFFLLLMFSDSYKPTLLFLALVLISVAIFWIAKCLNLSIAVNIWNKLNDRVLTAWLQPELDPWGKGYQILSAKKAASLGGWLGCSKEEMIYYQVPVEDSDMIFLKMLSAGGITLTGLVLLLFFLVFRECYYITVLIRKNSLGILVTALYLMLLSQVLLILCGSMGILPLTGVTLIFVGRGNLSLLCSIFTFGLILFSSAKKWRS